LKATSTVKEGCFAKRRLFVLLAKTFNFTASINVNVQETKVVAPWYLSAFSSILLDAYSWKFLENSDVIPDGDLPKTLRYFEYGHTKLNLFYCKPKTFWETESILFLLQPFTISVWIAFLVSFLVSVLIFLNASNEKSPVTTCFKIFSIFMKQDSPFKRTKLVDTKVQLQDQ
jgi:hypothetical protein